MRTAANAGREDPGANDPPSQTGVGPRRSRRLAVLTALAANLVIAVAKAAAAVVTGSSAMLSEALHSVADSVNEVLLLVGARRANRPADLRHPFGHARYRFLYAFVVSLTVFWIGGVLSVIEGVNHVIVRERIADPRWAFGVLALAFLLEGWSLRTTIGAWRGAKGELSWKRLLRDTKAPDLIVVFLEDLGAIIGVAIAALGVALATFTGDGAWDAIASIAIGVLLMAIGLVVNRETQSLLVGEAAAVDVVAAIRDAISSTEGIAGARALRTIHIGPEDLVVAAGVWVDAARSATDVTRSIDEAKRRVREVAPFRTVVTVEPRVRDADAPDG
ncbi:MAG TPA: cation diffusion facilitator family transporter [Candidatus Limnocylindrales bacterium]|jgi:cation diffusion facilitator family transporter